MTARPGFGALALALTALLLAACSEAAPGAAEVTPAGVPSSASAATATPATAPDFPTGPAVTVSDGYRPPTDRVDSTGAYLPLNGKPTLVFVDAIW